MAKFWHLDVINENEVKKAYADIVSKFGKLDALGKDSIGMNSVHPDFIRTPCVEALGKNDPGFRKHPASLYPIGDIGELNENAYDIFYLISDESKFVTGSELVIDGDYTFK